MRRPRRTGVWVAYGSMTSQLFHKMLGGQPQGRAVRKGEHVGAGFRIEGPNLVLQSQRLERPSSRASVGRPLRQRSVQVWCLMVFALGIRTRWELGL